MRRMGGLLRVVGLGLMLCFTAGMALAQTTASQSDRLAALEKASADQTAAIAAAQSAGDNAWMLVTAALVLMMSGPGLALFYGGLVRKKNVLGTMMQTFAMMAVITVLWAVVTYSLAFGSGQCVHRRPAQRVPAWRGSGAGCDYAATIPLQTFMVYQLMFAIITPALITGRIRRTHEVLGHAGVHGALGDCGLQPDGAHGLGQRAGC